MSDRLSYLILVKESLVHHRGHVQQRVAEAQEASLETGHCICCIAMNETRPGHERAEC